MSLIYIRDFIVFIFGSFLGAALDFLISWFLIVHGLTGLISLLISMFISAPIVYLYHEFITFRRCLSFQYSHSRLSQFLTSTLIIYGFRVALFYGLLALQVLEVIALLVALVSSVFINFFVSKLLIFKG